VFGWIAAAAEQSRPAPAAVWMGSGGSRAALEEYTPRCGFALSLKIRGTELLNSHFSLSSPSLLSHSSSRPTEASSPDDARWWPERPPIVSWWRGLGRRAGTPGGARWWLRAATGEARFCSDRARGANDGWCADEWSRGGARRLNIRSWWSSCPQRRISRTAKTSAMGGGQSSPELRCGVITVTISKSKGTGR
jgi:hypothetical protein